MSLILVYTLDLDVVEGVERDVNACTLFDILLKLCLILALNIDKSFNKVRVVDMVSKLLERLQVRDPLVYRADCVTD